MRDIDRLSRSLPQAFVEFPDRDLPITISLRAFSPLIPHDVRNSSLPVAIFVLRITNESRAPVDTSIALSWENILGVGGAAATGPFADRTGNLVAPIASSEGVFGLKFTAPDLPATLPKDRLRYNASSGASYALTCQAAQPDLVVTTASWNALDGAPAWWGEFSKSGTVSGQCSAGKEGSVHPAGVVAVKVSLKIATTERFRLQSHGIRHGCGRLTARSMDISTSRGFRTRSTLHGMR